MKIKCLIFVLFLLFIPLKVHCTPAEVEDISNRKYAPKVLEEINKAESTIFVTLYYIGYYGYEGVVKELMDGLVSASRRGVKVTVILDEGKRVNQYTQYLKNERAFAYLLHHGIDVFYDDLKTTTHSKMIVIDNEIIILGSTNWSAESLMKSREASILIRSKI